MQGLKPRAGGIKKKLRKSEATHSEKGRGAGNV